MVLDSGSGSGSLNRGIFEMKVRWDCLPVTSSRPSVTFRRSNPSPGLASWAKFSKSYTTLELKIAYHKAISEQTGKVRAEARVLSFGRRVAFSEGKLLDKEGRLLASATSTLLVIPSQGITQELGDERRTSGS
jgi:hypothetical protein